MQYIKRTWELFDNYILARWQNRPSTALFWYLTEPANIKSQHDLLKYQQMTSPIYFIDYRKKLDYALENQEGIITLPYGNQIGKQINPEAAFQYALGLHDQYWFTNNQYYINKFWHYVNYFRDTQSSAGLWSYNFDWHGSSAPWYSALAQSRGASVMLRAGLLSDKYQYFEIAKNALSKFTVSTHEGGFLHTFNRSKCLYFEEYPQTPTGVINGFMASLISIWEMQFWLQEPWLINLWELGIASLEAMLPYYSIGWWSLYDLDENTPLANINSPRYHLLEMNYLNVLYLISGNPILKQEYEKRTQQYAKLIARIKAIGLKYIRKIIYK